MPAVPLPLEATLRDLAVLRASDVRLADALPKESSTASDDADLEESVGKAVEFIKNARAVTRVDYAVEQLGSRLEGVRGVLAQVEQGVQHGP